MSYEFGGRVKGERHKFSIHNTGRARIQTQTCLSPKLIFLTAESHCHTASGSLALPLSWTSPHQASHARITCLVLSQCTRSLELGAKDAKPGFPLHDCSQQLNNLGCASVSPSMKYGQQQKVLGWSIFRWWGREEHSHYASPVNDLEHHTIPCLPMIWSTTQYLPE